MFFKIFSFNPNLLINIVIFRWISKYNYIIYLIFSKIRKVSIIISYKLIKDITYNL